jgi:hypothetical protein
MAEAEEVWARIEREEERKVIRSHLEWALGPPLAILVVGASLGWALAGFPRNAPRNYTVIGNRAGKGGAMGVDVDLR